MVHLCASEKVQDQKEKMLDLQIASGFSMCPFGFRCTESSVDILKDTLTDTCKQKVSLLCLL